MTDIQYLDPLTWPMLRQDYFVGNYASGRVYRYRHSGDYVGEISTGIYMADKITIFDNRLWYSDSNSSPTVLAKGFDGQTNAGGYQHPSAAHFGNAPAVVSDTVFYPLTEYATDGQAMVIILSADGSTYTGEFNVHGNHIYDIEATENVVVVSSIDEAPGGLGKLQFYSHSGSLVSETAGVADTYWQSIGISRDRIFVRAHDYIREYREDGSLVQTIAVPSPGQGWEYYEHIAATEQRLYLCGYDIDHIRVLDRAVTRDSNGDITSDVITDNSVTITCPETAYQTDIAVSR